MRARKPFKAVVFLDIDGVICTRRVHAAFKDSGTWWRPDPVATRLVSRLSVECGAAVVISSSWRKMDPREDIHGMLRKGGFRGFFHDDWATPVLKGFRGDEVAAWLAAHPEVEKWVALDDDHDFHPGQHLVSTHAEEGMMYAHYRQARAVLSADGDDPWDAVVADQMREADDRFAAAVRALAEAARLGQTFEARRLADVVEGMLAERGR